MKLSRIASVVASTALVLGAVAPAASAAEGTVGIPGCSVTYDTGTFEVNPSTGAVDYTGPSFRADTSSCLKGPPHG